MLDLTTSRLALLYRFLIVPSVVTVVRYTHFKGTGDLPRASQGSDMYVNIGNACCVISDIVDVVKSCTSFC